MLLGGPNSQIAAFLHVYHHSATVAMMFVQLNGQVTVVSNMLRSK